jgi:hypothetical protein
VRPGYSGPRPGTSPTPLASAAAAAGAYSSAATQAAAASISTPASNYQAQNSTRARVLRLPGPWHRVYSLGAKFIKSNPRLAPAS